MSNSFPAIQLAVEALMFLEKDHCLHSHALPLFASLPECTETRFSATGLHTLVAMVTAGLGSTLLPDLAVRAGILHGDTVTIRPLADGAHARRIGLARRRQSPRADEFRSLGGLIRDWAVVALSPSRRGRHFGHAIMIAAEAWRRWRGIAIAAAAEILHCISRRFLHLRNSINNSSF